MPNLRPVALIGLASAAAAIASLAFRFEGTPRLDRPKVYATIVRSDTVWFCAHAYPNAHPMAYGFVRKTRSWTSTRRSARCDREPRKPEFGDTLVRAGRGVAIHVVRPAPDSEGGIVGRSYLVVTDSARRRRVTLRPSYTPAQLRELKVRGEVEQDTTSVFVRDVIVNDTLVWIGLWGGMPEGDGVVGGVYRINRRTGAWRHIVDTTLSWHAVNGLAEVGGTLWIATEQPAEYGAFGNAGLLRLRESSMRWDSFSDKNSPLPDALIEDVSADARVVAVATEKGLAVGEIGPKGQVTRWNVRVYKPTFVGDSLVMALAERSAALRDSAESAFILVQRFAPPGHERALYEVARRGDPDSVLSIAGSYEPSARRLLADPSALPAIATLLGAGRESRMLASDALLQMKAPAPFIIPLVRSAFQSVDTATQELRAWSRLRANLGRVLTRANDSTGTQWAHGTLERSRREPRPADPVALALWNYNVAASANILADAKDYAALDQVLGVAPLVASESRGDLLDAILAFGIPSAWQAALGLNDAGYFDRYQFLDVLASVHGVDSLSAPRVSALITKSFADTNQQVRNRAFGAARRTRIASLVPTLVHSMELETAQAGYRDAMYTLLVDLTGRADAPVFTGAMPRSAAEWWSNLLATSGGMIPVVSTEEGERALSEWTRRRRVR